MCQRARRKAAAGARSKKLTEAGRQSVKPAGKDATAEDEQWIILPDSARREDDEPAFELYPENLAAWEVYAACLTQWRVGMNGRTGLDYTALECALRMMGIRRKQHPDIFWRVRCIEEGVLQRIAELSKQDG